MNKDAIVIALMKMMYQASTNKVIVSVHDIEDYRDYQLYSDHDFDKGQVTLYYERKKDADE